MTLQHALALLTLSACAAPAGSDDHAGPDASAQRTFDLAPAARPAPDGGAGLGLPGAEPVSSFASSELVSRGPLLATVEAHGSARELVVREDGVRSPRFKMELADGWVPIALADDARVALAGVGRVAIVGPRPRVERAVAVGARRGFFVGDRLVLAGDEEATSCDAKTLSCEPAVRAAVWAAGPRGVLVAIREADRLELGLGALGKKPDLRAPLDGPLLAAASAGERSLGVTVAGLVLLEGGVVRTQRLPLAPGLVALSADLALVATYDGQTLRVHRSGPPPSLVRELVGRASLVGLGFAGKHLWAAGPRGLVRIGPLE